MYGYRKVGLSCAPLLRILIGFLWRVEDEVGIAKKAKEWTWLVRSGVETLQGFIGFKFSTYTIIRSLGKII